MSFHLSPIGNDQQFDANGDPLNGGKIYTYLAGTTTPVATYTDDTGVTPQANPIILNSLGAPASPIWLTGGVTYKFVIKDANDVTLRTIDDISGINDFTSNAADEWTLYGSSPTYTSATSFTLVGDQTLIFQVGRRLKSANTGGTIYSSILTSVYSAPNTTVTVVNDSGSLDAGMSAVSYALLNATNPSVPYQYAKKAEIQAQTYTAFTTAGTATAFTLTPDPALAALTGRPRYAVKMNQANSGTTPTLAVSGTAATAIKMVAADGSKRDPVAGELAANLLVDMEYDGTHWVCRAVPAQLATATPSPNGTAAVGTSVKAAREDHVHASSGDFQQFDASGTWTKPSGYSASALVIMEAWGAGGGGGNGSGGSGGGGGGYARREMLYSDAASSYTVTIGAGAINTDGGNTTIGSVLTAYGGGRGRSTAGSSGGSGAGAAAAGTAGTASAGADGATGGDGYADSGGVGGVNSTSDAGKGGYDGGGGGGAGMAPSNSLGRTGGTGYYGGGGGGGGGNGANQAGNGGNSNWGGGGGAGDSSSGTDGGAGTSINGGNGGAVNTAGAQPGGGGGGGATGGAGGGGRVQITVIERA